MPRAMGSKVVSWVPLKHRPETVNECKGLIASTRSWVCVSESQANRQPCAALPLCHPYSYAERVGRCRPRLEAPQNRRQLPTTCRLRCHDLVIGDRDTCKPVLLLLPARPAHWKGDLPRL